MSKNSIFEKTPAKLLPMVGRVNTIVLLEARCLIS